MRSIFAILSLFVLAFAIHPNHTVDLQSAIDQKLIEVNVKSLGGYSGKCIGLEINNLTRKKLNLKVLAGTQFKSIDDDIQDIFVTQDQDFIVESNASKTQDIAGFCSQMSNSSPSEDQAFKVTRTTNANLEKLATYLSTHNVPQSDIQPAVWAITDGNSVAEIYGDSPESKELRKQICEWTGQKNVWYNNKTNYRVDANNNIVKEPVSVEGKLKAKIDKGGEIWYEVYDESGEKVSRNTGKGRLPSAGEYNLNFKLTVEGWEKGNYIVKLMFEGNPIHTAPFSVG